MIFSSGLSFPEGPVALPDRSWLVVELEAQPGCVTQISPDGRNKRIIAKTGRPNGLAVDKNGNIWVAESVQSSLLRMTFEGRTDVIASACDGQPFLWPNDLCFGPDGAIYMTDSGVRVCEYKNGTAPRPNFEKIPLDGRVFRIDPSTGEARKLDGGLRFTNGIAFGPDGGLYVNETRTGAVYRYAWSDGGQVGPREYFGQSNPDPVPGYQGPDGMAFSQDGRLFVAIFGRGRVNVMDAGGHVVDQMSTRGLKPTNVAFGLPGDKKIYVTENEFGALEAFDVGVDGLPLYN